MKKDSLSLESNDLKSLCDGDDFLGEGSYGKVYGL